MKRRTAIVWFLAALLTLPACATRDKQTGEQPAQLPVVAESAPEPAKSDADSPEVVHEPVWSSSQHQAGRAAFGTLGGALVGAVVPIAVFAPGGPIGVAIGLSLAPAGAAVGAAVGLARSTSSN